MAVDMRRSFSKWLTICVIASYGIYTAIGYGTLCFFGRSTTLVEYAIHPDDIEKKWLLLPFIDKVSLEILEHRSPEIVQQDFLQIGLTLGAVAGGFRYHSREMTPEQRKKSKEITVLILNKGVDVGIKYVDGGGCTALQGAIIGNDADVAKVLLEVGGEAATVANPNAKLKPCRQDAYTLAKQRGFLLPL
ncbi:MAG TPA: hypothetical protein VFF41_05315 [Gallionella sp.]|nr:hypothetical protein [Gallionella sp.]